MKIRKAEKKDIPEILRLIKIMGFTEHSLETWQGNNIEAVIAVENKSIIGAAPFAVRQFKINDNSYIKVGQMTAVGVKEELRSQGIGSSMLSFIKSHYSSQLDCLLVNRYDEQGRQRAYLWYQRNDFIDLANIRCLEAVPAELAVAKQGNYDVSLLKISEQNVNALNYNELLKIFNLTFKNIGGFEKRDKGFWQKRFKRHYFRKVNEYFVLRLFIDNLLVAYALFGKNFVRHKQGRMDVLEYGFDSSKVALQDLIYQAVGLCLKENIPLINFVVSDEITHHSELLSMGFKDVNGFKIMVFPFKPGLFNNKAPWTFFTFDYL